MTEKYLFSIEVEPYNPNRQLSILTSNGGKPKLHFPINGKSGLLVAMISFENVDNLEKEYDWIKNVHKGYYTVRKEFEV